MFATLIATVMTASIPLAAMPAAPVQPQPQTSAPVLTLHFEGVTAETGQIMIALFDADGWASGKPVRVALVDVAAGERDAMIAGLAPGRYAVRAYHDIDGDMKMGLNPFGIPTEPFGFSNDAMGERGAPDFDAASFDVGSTVVEQTITLR